MRTTYSEGSFLTGRGVWRAFSKKGMEALSPCNKGWRIGSIKTADDGKPGLKGGVGSATEDCGCG